MPAAAFAGGLGIGNHGQTAALPVVGFAGLGRAEARRRPTEQGEAQVAEQAGDEANTDASRNVRANTSRIAYRRPAMPLDSHA